MVTEIHSFASVMNRINPDFSAIGSEAWPGDTTLSSRWVYDAFGVHGVIFEASFQDVDYGPYQGQYMTIERYWALGVALGKAVAEFFYSVDVSEEAFSGAPTERN
jgi:hypothetical protein